MRKYAATAVRLVFLLCLIVVAIPLLGQRERQATPADQNEKKFFDQLRNLFGRFRDADLQRAFEMARPIDCSELVSDNGEWRSVAFFNEDRKLGDWYHSSLDAVKADLSVYAFKGSCNTDQSTVQLVTKFPIRESLDRYNDQRISIRDVAVNVNAPVNASFDSRSLSYRFELPYLYAIRGRTNADTVYSLVAARRADRYVTNVTNHWSCKSVRANDVTFHFIICETSTLPRDVDPRSRAPQSFGTYAYFILSDGKEASTSMKLSFGTTGDEEHSPAPAADEPAERATDAVAARAADDGPLASWQIPGSASKLSEVDKGEFRIRFSPQTWANKIGAAQVLIDQKMSSHDPAKPPTGVDYCVWRPASASLATRVLGNDPDVDVGYTLTTNDMWMSFEMKTHNGSRLGTLQCFFPGAETRTVTVDRWVGVVGGHLTIEVLP